MTETPLKSLCSREQPNRHTGECRYPGCYRYWTPAFAGVTELMCLGVFPKVFFELEIH